MFGKLANQWCCKLQREHGPMAFRGLKPSLFLEKQTQQLLLSSRKVKAEVEAKAEAKVPVDHQPKALQLTSVARHETRVA